MPVNPSPADIRTARETAGLTQTQAAALIFPTLFFPSGNAQTAIVVYAGSAHTLVPLSDDLATSRNLLDALRPSIMPEAGHRADLAVEKALGLLKQGGLGQGRGRQQRPAALPGGVGLCA